MGPVLRPLTKGEKIVLLKTLKMEKILMEEVVFCITK
jgi:hypothetical protein